MSITDELRKYANRFKNSHDAWSGIGDDLTAIADRIDAEHRKAEAELMARNGQAWLHGYDECHTELLEGNETLASDLEGCGWIRLPKDADNVPVCIGDRMEWVRYKDGDPTIVRTVSGIGNGVFFAWSDEQGRYAQYEAHAYRHYHAPTVEDVLREFTDAILEWSGKSGTVAEVGTWSDIAADYAAKLRLAEGEDA